VAEAVGLALGPQRLVGRLEVGREGGDAGSEVGRVGLAHEQALTLGAVDRHAAGAVGRHRVALLVRERWRRGEEGADCNGGDRDGADKRGERPSPHAPEA
jgi:hypothetical protein